jgi:uncharacterized membrane protein
MHAAFTRISLAAWAITIAAALGNVVLVATRYSSLPAQVPTHYGFFGRPDAWGGKNVMWLVALMPLLIALLMLGIMITMVATAEAAGFDEVRAGVRIVALRMLAVAEKNADGIGRLVMPLYLVGLALVIFLVR